MGSLPKYVLRMIKGGIIRYLSHQETSTAIERTLRRAKLPLSFTKGYHPHIKLSYLPAVLTGVATAAIYMTIETESPVTDITERISKAAPFGISLLKVWEVDEKFDLRSVADSYQYFLFLPKNCFDPSRFSEATEITKQTKKSRKIFLAKETYQHLSVSALRNYFMVKYFQPMDKSLSYQHLIKIMSKEKSLSEKGIYVFVLEAYKDGVPTSNILDYIGGKKHVRSQ